MKKILNAFYDNKGKLSLMRILSAFVIVLPISVWAAVCIYTWQIQIFPEGIAMIVGAAFGGKAVQSFAEKDTK